MTKKFLLLLVFSFCISIIAFAQEQATMNLALRNYVNENPNSTEQLQLLAQGNETAIQSAVKNLGGNFKYSVQDICAVTLSVNKIFLLSQTSGIKRIEGRHGIGNALDDQTDIHADITPVKQGQSPLPQGYDGSGVVIGIIDTEIDIAHPDFKDVSGNTRIKFLWSQLDTAGGTTPMPYNYGQEWDAASIDAGCSYIPTQSAFSHGSVVTGAAAGDPDSIQFQGVAPKTDLIFVAADLGPNFLNNTVDAINYIYTKAALLGKPCVINASVGTYNGSHDGLDLPAIAIDNLITADSARSFVAAAGNAGDKLLHLQYPVEIDSAFTWFKYEPSLSKVYYELWAYKTQFDSMYFALGADKTTPYTYLGRTNYYNILTDFNFSAGFAQLDDTLKTWSGTVIGTITIQAETIDTTYHLAIHINTTNTAYLYRLSTKGSGQFDIWSNPAITGTSNMVKPVNLPPVSTFPDVARYRGPNQTQTIVSSFQCSDKVITVGNFNNRNTWTDVTGNPYTTTDTVGQRGITSSIGSTRDGRMKPDISAPGNNTFGALMQSMQATFISNNGWKVSSDSMHLIDGGTSMAAPVVAGIIALYMQRYPTLNWLQIKNAVIASAITDSFTTTNVPNFKWGYGKIDAFKLLDTLIGVPNCQPTSSSISQQICEGDVFNFNGTSITSPGIYFDTLQNAGGCDSLLTLTLTVDSIDVSFAISTGASSITATSTEPNITYQWYNCDSSSIISGATNSSFTPSVSGTYAVIITDSIGCSKMSICVFATPDGIEWLNNFSLNIFPNPANDNLTIESRQLIGNVISFTDVLGKELLNEKINKNTEIINLNTFAPGIYYCTLKNGKTILAVRKFIKL